MRSPSRSWLIPLCTLVLCCAFGRTQDPPSQPLDPVSQKALKLDEHIIGMAEKESELLANLTYLSDIIGPRLTGSAALQRANVWAAGVMKRYGLANVQLEAW